MSVFCSDSKSEQKETSETKGKYYDIVITIVALAELLLESMVFILGKCSTKKCQFLLEQLWP